MKLNLNFLILTYLKVDKNQKYKVFKLFKLTWQNKSNNIS